jgi:hypothetical protein
MIRHGSPYSIAVVIASRPMRTCAPTSWGRSKLRPVFAGLGIHRGPIAPEGLASLPMIGKPARLVQSPQSTPKPFNP